MKPPHVSRTPALNWTFHRNVMLIMFAAFALLPGLAAIIWGLGAAVFGISYALLAALWLVLRGTVVLGILAVIGGGKVIADGKPGERLEGAGVALSGAIAVAVGWQFQGSVNGWCAAIAAAGDWTYACAGSVAKILFRRLWLESGAWSWPLWILLVSFASVPAAGLTIAVLRGWDWWRTRRLNLRFACPLCHLGRVHRTCPGCHKRHPDLTAGKEGIFFRSCSCGHRLGTTDLSRRSDIPVSCDRCGSYDVFPQYGAGFEQHVVLWGFEDDVRLALREAIVSRLRACEPQRPRITPHVATTQPLWEGARDRASPRLSIFRLISQHGRDVTLWIHLPDANECRQAGLPPDQPLDAIVACFAPHPRRGRRAGTEAGWPELDTLNQAIERQFPHLSPTASCPLPVCVLGLAETDLPTPAEAGWRQRFANLKRVEGPLPDALEATMDWLIATLQLPLSGGLRAAEERHPSKLPWTSEQSA